MDTAFVSALSAALREASEPLVRLAAIAATNRVSGSAGRLSVKLTVTIRPATTKGSVYSLDLDGADFGLRINISTQEFQDYGSDVSYWKSFIKHQLMEFEPYEYPTADSAEAAAELIFSGMATTLAGVVSELAPGAKKTICQK